MVLPLLLIIVMTLRIEVFLRVNLYLQERYCVRTGTILISIESTFWDNSDYDKSNIPVALDCRNNIHKFTIIDRHEKPNYVDYAQDPLDHALVNSQIEIFESHLIALKCVKNCLPVDKI